ncbi:hypothetical protein pdam_00001421 [Pocillopora damicornis]|uniref:Uncharacterized protein n=1 Tax=Pocillopora damicornis TaxID=46731 RepID=A0A3M6V3V7_POCDA|nr:hypothetical protein pdam_00001421 [Pocillopora damicornis]
MVLNQNQVSSKHLKMRLARRYTSASPDGVKNDSQIVEVKRIGLKEGESLDDGICGLGIYKKNGFVLVSSTASLSDSISCLIEAISSLRSFDSLRPST